MIVESKDALFVSHLRFTEGEDGTAGTHLKHFHFSCAEPSCKVGSIRRVDHTGDVHTYGGVGEGVTELRYEG